MVRLKHDVLHEPGIRISELSADDIIRIRILSQHGLSPFQIRSSFETEWRTATWEQIYFRWTLIQQESYLRDSDPFNFYHIYISRLIRIWILFLSRIRLELLISLH